MVLFPARFNSPYSAQHCKSFFSINIRLILLDLCHEILVSFSARFVKKMLFTNTSKLLLLKLFKQFMALLLRSAVFTILVSHLNQFQHFKRRVHV